MDVAPGSLGGVVEEDAAAAAGLEEGIDGANTPIRGFRSIPPIAGPLREGYLRPVADQTHRFGKVAEQAVAGCGHLGRGFRQGELHERVLGDSALIARGNARRRLVAKRRERSQRDADGRGADARRKDEPEGQAVEWRVVDDGAGIRQIERIAVRVGPVLGHEGIVHHQILAPGAAEPDRIPRVVDRVVRAWDQKGPRVRGGSFLEGRRDAAEHGPVAEVAPARERPAAMEAETSIDPLHGPRGRQRRRKLDARVLTPDAVMRLRREEAEMPVVNTDHAEDPGARAADGSDLYDRLVERAGIELVAAIALGLETTKEPGLLEVSEGLVGQPPELFGMDGAFAQRREQRANPLEIRLRRHGATDHAAGTRRGQDARTDSRALRVVRQPWMRPTFLASTGSIASNAPRQASSMPA